MRGDYRRRWYGFLSDWKGERGPVQMGTALRRAARSDEPVTLPMPVLKMAADEYNAQGYGQSLERLNERGGLSLMEVIALLADAVDCERSSD